MCFPFTTTSTNVVGVKSATLCRIVRFSEGRKLALVSVKICKGFGEAGAMGFMRGLTLPPFHAPGWGKETADAVIIQNRL